MSYGSQELAPRLLSSSRGGWANKMYFFPESVLLLHSRAHFEYETFIAHESIINIERQESHEIKIAIYPTDIKTYDHATC